MALQWQHHRHNKPFLWKGTLHSGGTVPALHRASLLSQMRHDFIRHLIHPYLIVQSHHITRSEALSITARLPAVNDKPFDAPGGMGRSSYFLQHTH